MADTRDIVERLTEAREEMHRRGLNSAFHNARIQAQRWGSVVGLALIELASQRDEIERLRRTAPAGEVGELLTASQLMDEVEEFCAAAGVPQNGKVFRDGFEGRCLVRGKGVLVHAVATSLKVEEVKMYRRTAPKQAPSSGKEAQP